MEKDDESGYSLFMHPPIYRNTNAVKIICATGDELLILDADRTRLAVSQVADPKRKSRLGQFFTPYSIARFMAGLFDRGLASHCRLLDAGAGIGSLSSAFLERWAAGGFDFKSVELDAFEVDEALRPLLKRALENASLLSNLSPNVRGEDFIETAADWVAGGLLAKAAPGYTHAILNPPYKKIRSDSAHRLALRRAGIETVNLYSAFVALSLALLDNGGQLVAIIPRSFCNGPYYKPFRDFLLDRAAIRRLHLFESRSKAFKDDGVLQENVIIHLERGAPQGQVTVSTSSGDSFSDIVSHGHPFERIVFPGDPQRFVHVPASPGHTALERCAAVCYSLADIGVTVSTGPVVEYRLKQHLLAMPQPGAVPMLYPGHFRGGGIQWPKEGTKKPNAIRRNSDTAKWLYPNGYYCVVRRFSAKEEKRRIVASVVDPGAFGDAPALGFENHLNVFHENKGGLSRELALGLAAFLNAKSVDDYFRRFNGHTQVNATDLRLLGYPSRKALIELGAWVSKQDKPARAAIDERLESMTA